MADPYAPFGFAPRFPTLSGRENVRLPLADMPMLPPPPVMTNALMPQSAGEAEELARQGQSAANMVSMAAPFAIGGPVGSGINWGGRTLAALATRFPRAATMAAAGAGLTGQSTAAGPKARSTKAAPGKTSTDADPQMQRLLESDPVLRQLQSQLNEQEKIANDQGKYKSVRDGARARAADIQTKFNERLGELSRANLPFEQAYPMLAQNRGLIGFLAPAAVGYATRTAGNLLSRIGPARWERALQQADRALERGNDQAYQHYMARAARFEPGPEGTMSRIGHMAAPPIAGGTVGAELSMLPYQHNITNAPLGSPQRAEAEQMMADPWKWGPRAAFGFGIGALGGATGGHLPNVSPGFRPPPGGPAGPSSPGPMPGGAALPQASPPTAAPPAPAIPPPPPSSPPSGAMWPPPPRVPNPPPPGLATLGSPRPFGPSPTDSPPQPLSTVGAPARPMPQGAYQDASGRWRVRGRWIRDPSK